MPESYKVVFTVKKEDGYYERTSEIVKVKGKNSHKKAENFILRKHGISPESIIGVYYQ